MPNKKFVIIIPVTALVFFFAGYYASLQLSQLSRPPAGDTFQAGWEAAKQRLAETGFAPLLAQGEIKSLSGQVQKIEGTKINLKIQPLEPLADSALDNRMVETDGGAKVFRLVQKDAGEFQKEMEEFSKETQPSPLPDPFTKEQIGLADIEVGQWITVTADKDIKDAKEFKAVEILAQMQMEPAI